MEKLSDNSLSLYFGLHENRKADLEVVSKAAIEWVNSVRLATNMIEPSANVRVQVINAHESSLSINTILDWGEQALENVKHPRLTSTAVGIALFLLVDAGPAAEYWFGEPDQIEITESEREVLNELLKQISKSEELKSTNRKFFKTISDDPAVSSVGVCEHPGGKPAFSVPSSQFAERSGLWEQEEVPQERTSERISDVILETPNLSDSDRVWRFVDIETGIPFSAKMRDENFVNSLQEGSIHETLRIGIKMRIHIKFKEKFIDGEWKSVQSTIEVLKATIAS